VSFVPVVDISGDPATVGAELDEICRTAGFFQVTGHGVPRKVAERAWTTATRFFDLPPADKLSVVRPGPDYPYGWSIRPTRRGRRVAVNVESALLLAQAFVPGMAARGFGRIIFVVSDTVWAPPAADLLPYVTSKARWSPWPGRWPWRTARTGSRSPAWPPG
jgi:NAD(P)-dependent dehydrogenase (short-subunit alcohol dehydrogenase family)